jgi:uncharacterized protein
MMANFTPVSAFVGGALIGLAALILVLFNGRLAGISGIIGGAVQAPRDDLVWRAAFVAGLVAAPLVYAAADGEISPATAVVPPATLAVAGLIVGFGTRLGNGCTSGHAVCGLARLSPRGLVATLVFMAAAFGTVFLTRHAIGG